MPTRSLPGAPLRWAAGAAAVVAVAAGCSSGSSAASAAGTPAVAASASATCARFVGHADDLVAQMRTDLTIADAGKIAAEFGDGSDTSATVLGTWATTADSMRDSASAEGQQQVSADAAALGAAIRSFAATSKGGGQGSASSANVTAAAAMAAAVKKLGTDCAWDGKP